MATVIVIINEQHSLFAQQEEILAEKFGSFTRKEIPSQGMNLEELRELAQELEVEGDIVVASPIPALMKLFSQQGKQFFVFHNDERKKTELPNGKIIMTVAEEGWVIV